MNYNEFMKIVNNKLLIMTDIDKTKWIQNIARTTNKNERIKFLNSLSENKDIEISKKNEIQKIEKWCEKIESGEIYFECVGYEEYGESYWDRDYTYEYTDTFNIGETISRSFQVAEDVLFQKEYKEAAKLYELLFNLNFSVLENDIEEWRNIELDELVENRLLKIDLRNIFLNMLYTKYQIIDGKERASEFYQYISRDICKDIKIEEIFTVGPEEPKNIDLFIVEWIEFLKDIDGDLAGNLLTEACLYHGGITFLSKLAKDVSEKHPVLYKYACEYMLNDENYVECEKLGLEAINVLPEKLIIRGKIAGLTLKASTKLKNTNNIKKFSKAAFYSESSLNNYLRLYELPDCSILTDEAANHAKRLAEKTQFQMNYKNTQLHVNIISKEDKNIITIFNGDFDYIYGMCKKDKALLGWSSSFKGIAIPLFVLILDKNDKMTKAGKKLISEMNYRLGFEEKDDINFIESFLIWKNKMNITEDHYNKYVEWLKKEIDKRVEAVVGGTHRKSYHKAAAIITAFGEMLESNGVFNERKNLIDHYKNIHSRKRAFKAEFEELN
ncbi:MAG: hypothetical protein ABF289_09755 [Clostridiales bacterium]